MGAREGILGKANCGASKMLKALIVRQRGHTYTTKLAKPIPANPISSIAHVVGSGTPAIAKHQNRY
jgi:hypothetical protein